MKGLFRIILCCFIFSTAFVHSQKSEPNKVKLESEEEEPIMFQFEPNYASAQLKHREALLLKIRALDTLHISEKKRLRLIKALYKDLNSEKFQKTILVETQFEDIDYDDDNQE